MKLFFVGAGGGDAAERLTSFMAGGLDARIIRRLSPALDSPSAEALEEIDGLWAIRDSPRNRVWSARLEPGDVAIGYAEGKYVATGHLLSFANASGLGWRIASQTGPADTVLLFFAQSRRIDVKRDRVNNALGYSPKFVPRGLFLPGHERQSFVGTYFESVAQFVDILADPKAKLPAAFPRKLPPDIERREEEPTWLEPERDRFDKLVIPRGLPEEAVAAEQRRPFAALDAPTAVVVSEPFWVAVGLRPNPDPRVSSSFFRDAPEHEYELDVRLIAEGFDAVDDRWTERITVSRDEPFPRAQFQLSPKPTNPKSAVRAIQAIYEVRGRVLGFGARFINVLSDRRQHGPHLPPPMNDFTLPLLEDQPTPDLTVCVFRSMESEGTLLWWVSTPHDVSLPRSVLRSRIGQAPHSFARFVLDGVPDHEGQDDLFDFLRGVGVELRNRMPGELVAALRDIGRLRIGEPLSLFFLSEEPWVPWELAVIEDPPYPSRSPFLATQTTMGRWVVYLNRSRLAPRSAAGDPFRVVAANYPKKSHLPGALAEADSLRKAFGATSVEARSAPVRRCLAGSPLASVLHFALHGKSRPHTTQEGLLLEDGFLEPTIVRGTELATSSLVFLNACEVGAGNESLGAYGGTAEAFVSAGASAVVAPLWSVDDEDAKEVALEFYRRTLTGELPAAVLRDERERFQAGNQSATRLAYQFFGHPLMKIS